MICLQRKDHLLSKIYCPFSDLTDRCNVIQYYCCMFPKLYFNCLSDKKDALIIMPNCAERTMAKRGMCIDVPKCFYGLNGVRESKGKMLRKQMNSLGMCKDFYWNHIEGPYEKQRKILIREENTVFLCQNVLVDWWTA